MHAERALPSPEELLERSADGVALLDPEGYTLYTNPAALRLLGLIAPEPGLFVDRLHPEDRAAFRAACDAALESEGAAAMRVAVRTGRRHPDARRLDEIRDAQAPVPARHLEAGITAVTESDDRRWLMVSLRERPAESARPRPVRDPVELREGQWHPAAEGPESEAELRAKGHMLDLLLENLPVIACRLDADGRVVEARAAAAAADWPESRVFMERVLRGETVHFEHESGLGSRKRVREIWFTPNPVDGGVIGLGVDVTDRKRAEEELSKSEALGRRIIESSRDNIMVLDATGRVVSISQSGRKLLEIEDPEAFLGRSWLDFWLGDDRNRAEEAFVAAGYAGLGKFQAYCPTVSGKPKWWDVVLTPILNTAWEPERFVAICRDITDQKRFEESLRRSKDQMEAVLRAVTDALLMADASGRVVYATDAAARVFGRASSQELLECDLDELARGLSAEDERGEPSIWPRPAPGPHGEATVLRLRTLRGFAAESERWVVANTATLSDAEGRTSLIIASANDFTERQRAEAALKQSELHLRQSQKMEAVGRLAGGVAHDFNNLLTAINGYAELLAKSLDERNPLQETVHEIRRAGERAASLTRQLLTFSRRQVPASRQIDLNAIVADIRQMLGRLIGEDIGLHTALDAGLGPIHADPGQMEQLLLNLALNARDAMPGGGSLTIRTANVDLEQEDAGALFAVVPGRYAKLTVSDTGIGMDENVKAHLFEPFFTTKPAGQGTGLGLSTVYGIVKATGGNLAVTSEPGRGTHFSIYLPITSQTQVEAEEPGGETAGASASTAGRETILLAEDEDMVRRLIGQVLQSHGYRVIEAGSGPEALNAAASHQGRIDLLLTDVVMAGMSGRELSEKLVSMLPEVKVLYMSGYTDDAILRHGVFNKGAAFLGKPFSPGVLVRKLREVLEPNLRTASV